MAFATLSAPGSSPRSDVIDALVSMPQTGAWRARLAIDSQVAPSGPVVLSAADGAVEWHGTVAKAGVTRDTCFAFLIGGGGGIARQLPAKFYSRATAQLVLQDALQACGERLSPLSSAATIGASLPQWTRASGSLGECLRAVCLRLGASWRVLRDGSVWVGVETWPVVQLDHIEMELEPAAGRMDLASEVPSLTPGVTLAGRQVTRVEHRIGAKIRTCAWFLTDGVQGDDFAAALPPMVRLLTSHVDYFAQYSATVVAQNGDGSLELKPEDPRLPGMSKIPIRYGIPGVAALVAPGARVLVGFEAGNPAHPIATVWESASIISLTFDGNPATPMPFARAGIDTAGPWPIIGGNLKVKG